LRRCMRTMTRDRSDNAIKTKEVAPASQVGFGEGGNLIAHGRKRRPANLTYAPSDIVLRC
jgi:hypothetical protein